MRESVVFLNTIVNFLVIRSAGVFAKSRPMLGFTSSNQALVTTPKLVTFLFFSTRQYGASHL